MRMGRSPLSVTCACAHVRVCACACVPRYEYEGGGDPHLTAAQKAVLVQHTLFSSFPESLMIFVQLTVVNNWQDIVHPIMYAVAAEHLEACLASSVVH